MADRFTFEEIAGEGGSKHYRISDGEDNRVATCYVLENAQMVTRALNQASKSERREDQSVSVERY